MVPKEKADGANAAVSFDENGTLLLQSRGHYLNGGPRGAFQSVQAMGNCAHPIPEAVIADFLRKLEPPMVKEAHRVEWVITEINPAKKTVSPPL